MSGRRTNLALLGLLAGALATGTVAFATGAGAARAITVVHGVVGVTLLVLARPKSRVVRRGLRRRGLLPARGGVRGVGGGVGGVGGGRESRPRDSSAWSSLALAGLVVATVVTGLAHSAGLATLGLGLRTMQVHVGAALTVVPLAVWHVLARPARPRRTDLSRRTLLRGGTVAAAGGALYAAVGGAVTLVGLPGARRRATGSHETGSGDPAAMPVTSWIDDPVPALDAGGWVLTVGGGRGTRRWTAGDLAAFDDAVTATLDCTGGWYATQEWAGARLDRLVGDPGDARSVVVRSVTGYTRRFPVADLPHLLLATRVAGAQLSPGHGFPARLVAPGRRGFWWVKWVDEITLDTRPAWLQPPFPLT